MTDTTTTTTTNTTNSTTTTTNNTVRDSILQMIETKTNEMESVKKEVAQLKELLKIHKHELKSHSQKKTQATQA